MKTLALAAISAVLLMTGTAHAETLKLKIEGVQPLGGSVMVAVQRRDEYMLPIMATGAIVDGKTSGDVVLNLPIEAGEYAVTVLHDADGNYDMNLDAQGNPAEGWATVNQALLRARPTFDQVKFVVAGDTEISLPLVYPAR